MPYDDLRRRRDDEVIDKIFEKLDKISETQVRQSDHIARINRTLYENNGEKCICTKLDDLQTSIEELKTKRLVLVSTAQAIWTIIFGFLSVTGTVTAIMLTIKQLRGG